MANELRIIKESNLTGLPNTDKHIYPITATKAVIDEFGYSIDGYIYRNNTVFSAKLDSNIPGYGTASDTMGETLYSIEIPTDKSQGTNIVTFSVPDVNLSSNVKLNKNPLLLKDSGWLDIPQGYLRPGYVYMASRTFYSNGPVWVLQSAVHVSDGEDSNFINADGSYQSIETDRGVAFSLFEAKRLKNRILSLATIIGRMETDVDSLQRSNTYLLEKITALENKVF